MSQIKGELKTNESNSESDNEFDKYQNICDGLHSLHILKCMLCFSVTLLNP